MGAVPATVVVLTSNSETEAVVRAALEPGSSQPLTTVDPARALELLEERAADLVVADCEPGSNDTWAWLDLVRHRWPTLPVVLVARQGSTDDVVRALNAGAFDLLVPPVTAGQVEFALQKALLSAQRVAAAPPPPTELGIVFGNSPAMRQVKELIEQVAPSASTVLVRGESGTGKELVARALHRMSTRARGPCIKIDCTALPENLIESELFGHERGAFTGASAKKLGRVELANGGTLFLDEVGELPLATQSKLLRLLQDREFERLGGTETVSVDVRIVAATHRDLETMVEREEFRQDLYYRLSVVPIWIAPLRARRADIQPLVQHFCARAAHDNGKSLTMSDAALKELSAQRWPGNVRQLQNFVERLVVLCRSSTITEEDVLSELNRPVRFATETGHAGADSVASAEGSKDHVSLDEALKMAERATLQRALERVDGNRSAAARTLGVSRTTLYAKLREYGML